MLERFGVAVSPGEMKVENIAAVLVTARARSVRADRRALDVTASSIGDARSLQGGTLLPTPLRGPDGQIVALAQGPLSIGGFGGGGGGNSVQVNHLTVGRVPSGALVQVARPRRSPPADDAAPRAARAGLHVRRPRRAGDQHGARRRRGARRSTPASVRVQVPDAVSRAALPELMARLEPLPVAVDASARVVINERTGTVVVGGDVRLGPAAVAHGNLSVRISTQFDVSQPAPFSQGRDDGGAADARSTSTKATRSWSRSSRARRSATSSAR